MDDDGQWQLAYYVLTKVSMATNLGETVKVDLVTSKNRTHKGCARGFSTFSGADAMAEWEVAGHRPTYLELASMSVLYVSSKPACLEKRRRGLPRRQVSSCVHGGDGHQETIGLEYLIASLHLPCPWDVRRIARMGKSILGVAEGEGRKKENGNDTTSD
ncbi:unnamed protein product [Urochloa humidicola]